MIHDETGLLGIAGAAADKVRAGELMHVFCEHFVHLTRVPVRCGVGLRRFSSKKTYGIKLSCWLQLDGGSVIGVRFTKPPTLISRTNRLIFFA